MKMIWIVAADVDEFGRIYLPEYAARDKNSVIDRVMDRARAEGFRGGAEERLAALGWEIVPVRIEEIRE
jgi:hypothetical protein